MKMLKEDINVIKCICDIAEGSKAGMFSSLNSIYRKLCHEETSSNFVSKYNNDDVITEMLCAAISRLSKSIPENYDKKAWEHVAGYIEAGTLKRYVSNVIKIYNTLSVISLRKSVGMSQEEFGKKVGVTGNTVSTIESTGYISNRSRRMIGDVYERSVGIKFSGDPIVEMVRIMFFIPFMMISKED